LDYHIRPAVRERATIINTTEQLKHTTECKEGFLMNPKNYGGIDVAKKNFVIGIYGQDKTKTEANTPKGHAKAVEYLQKHNVDLVVLESTGGLEVPLANALHAADIRVVIANPQRTHQYAASFSLGKTDHLDAKMLADYAQALDSRKMADDMRWVKDDNPSSAINNKPELTANGKSAAQNRWIAYNKMRGHYSSAMEHAVPEQFWVDKNQCKHTDENGIIKNPALRPCAEGISAVKAITIAQSQGQKIYTINRNNAAMALPKLPVGGDTGAEIRNAIQAGKEVTVHQSPINSHGWTGYGYGVVDPDTGAGGYIIEGKGNGGWMDLAEWIKNNPGWSAIAALVLGLLAGVGGLLGAVFLLMSLAISATSLYYDMMNITSEECGGPAMAGLFSVLALCVFLGGLFFSGVGVAVSFAAAGYLISEFHQGVTGALKGNRIFCP